MPQTYRSDEIRFQDSKTYRADEIQFKDDPASASLPHIPRNFIDLTETVGKNAFPLSPNALEILRGALLQPSGARDEVDNLSYAAGKYGLPLGASMALVNPAAAAWVRALQAAAAGGGTEAARNLIATRDVNKSAREGVSTAIGYGVGEGAIPAAGAVLRAFKKPAVNVGAGLLKIGQNIRRNVGEAVLSSPGKLANAPTEEMVSKAYGDFYKSASSAGEKVTGRKEFIRASDDPFDMPQRAYADMKGAYQKLKEGTLSIQEAISASQAARRLRDAKMRGNEFAREIADTADDLKGFFDDFIEKSYPDWQRVREMNFWKEAAEELSSPFPLNANKSENALRGSLSFTAGIGGALAGYPGALAIPILQSPLLTGTALRAAYRASKVAPVAARAAGASKAKDLSEYYMRQPAFAR